MNADEIVAAIKGASGTDVAIALDDSEFYALTAQHPELKRLFTKSKGEYFADPSDLQRMLRIGK